MFGITVLLLAGVAAADTLYGKPAPPDWSTLPIQIGAILGAYVAFIAVVGIGFLFAKRRRHRMLRLATIETDVKRRPTVVEYVTLSDDLKSNDARKRAMEMENLYHVRESYSKPQMPSEKVHTIIPARGSVASRASKKDSVRNVRISAPIAPPELHKRFEAYKRASDEEPLSQNAVPPSHSEALRGSPALDWRASPANDRRGPPTVDRRSPPMDALRSSPATGHARRQPSVSSIGSQTSQNFSRLPHQSVDNKYQDRYNDRNDRYQSTQSSDIRYQSAHSRSRPNINTDLPEPPRAPSSRHGSITSPQREPARQNSLTSVRSFSRPMGRNGTPPTQSPESQYGPFSDQHQSIESAYGSMNRQLPFRQNSPATQELPYSRPLPLHEEEMRDDRSARKALKEFTFDDAASTTGSVKSMNRPLPFREAYGDNATPKPPRSALASPALPLRSEEPDRIVNTVLERKPKAVPRKAGPLSPRGMLSPTTPFTPFTPMSPMMPVSPRLVTREERKQTQRMMGSLAQELAKSDAELW